VETWGWFFRLSTDRHFHGLAIRSAAGNTLVNPNKGVLLVASNLPQLIADKTYEMWLIPKGSTPRPAGLFQSDPSGVAVHTATPDVIVVTLEPESGSAAPTSSPIIAVPVGVGRPSHSMTTAARLTALY
jgi:anti-sigma-K factor RskA